MAEKRITSQDVANLAGVSRTTVSFVVNKNPRFSIRPGTVQKVQEAARVLGYIPNATARALASRRAKAVGLVMTRDPRYIASDPFLPQILGGLLDVVKQAQLNLLTDWVEPGQQYQTYSSLIRAKHIDGMILMTPRYDDPGLKALRETDIPVVLMGMVPGCDLYSVDVENVAAARTAVRHLISLGHQRIACILNAPSPYSSACQRLQGYQQALEEAGLAYDETLVGFADFDATSGYSQMRSLLAERPGFTAAFVASDNVALGALAAILDTGLKVPDDISLVGFDDIPMSSYIHPALTTIHMPAREIAQQSCHLLMRLIAGERPEERALTLPTELITRGSTRELGRSK